MKGIKVGSKLVDIPSGAFDLTTNSHSGVFIDSRTMVMVVKNEAYHPVSEALTLAINLLKTRSPIGLDLCFEEPCNFSNINVVTFQFDRADWEVPTENYVVVDGNSAICAAFQGSLYDWINGFN